MTGTWALWVSTGLGLWLLTAPSVLGVDIRSGAADLTHIGGAAVVVISVMAMGEVIRVFRLANVAVGAVLAVLAVLAGAGPLYAVTVGVAGLAAAGLAIPRGRVRERYGAWDRVVR